MYSESSLSEGSKLGLDLGVPSTSSCVNVRFAYDLLNNCLVALVFLFWNKSLTRGANKRNLLKFFVKRIYKIGFFFKL